MKKKIIKTAILGIFIGITIGYLITILISLIWANGYYAPCVPELINVMESEINAVIFQTILCAFLGAGFAVSSLIWQKDEWSIVKQTGCYFIAISVIMLPVAYFTYWMEHSVKGFITYLGIFVIIFIVIWLIQFIIGKHNVNKLNTKLEQIKK